MKQPKSAYTQLINRLHQQSPTLAQKFSLTTNLSAIVMHSMAAGTVLFPAGFAKVASQKLSLSKLNQSADDTIIAIANRWIKRNNWLIDHALPNKNWQITVSDDIHPDKNYLLICNHQSWVDTSIIQYISSGRLPLTRFFIKKELIFIPIVGQAFYFLDFPMMKRYSKDQIAKNPALKGQDLAEVRRACRLLQNKPFVLLNYLEGTRFNQTKHTQQNSPFVHLLKPKAGGFALAMASLGDKIDGILDMTVVYPDGIPEYGDLWSGNLQNLAVDIQKIHMPDDLQNFLKQGAYHDENHAQHAYTKDQLHLWLDEIWQQKDQKISALLQQFTENQHT